MTKTILLPLFTCLCLVPSWGFPSDVRVNSVGNLNLVLDDETADINPFNFGNPAGLSLLPPQSRFDVAAPWFQQTPATYSSGQIQAYGSMAKMADNFSTSNLLAATGSAFTYQGFILFLTPQWAFQASGDLLHATNQPDSFFGLDNSLDRDRGMARTAYNFGPFSLGTEVDFGQTIKNLPSFYSGGPNGQGTITALTSNSGLLLNLPLNAEKKPTQLIIGGEYTLQASPIQEKDDITTNISSTPVGLTTTFQSQDYQTFGSDTYLEIPDTLQTGIITRFSNSDLDFQLDSSNTSLLNSISSYKLNTSNSYLAAGLFKMRLPLAGTLRQKLTVNSGGYVLVGGDQSTLYDSSGAATQTSNGTDIQAGVGIGIENERDFTVGLQAAMDSQSGNTTAGLLSYPLSYFGFSVSAGGERWINAHWAFRMGLAFEDDFNGGSSSVQKPFYAVPPGDRVISTTLNAGVGFQDSAFRSDFRLWTGQPSLYESSLPNSFATQVGVELFAGILFN